MQDSNRTANWSKFGQNHREGATLHNILDLDQFPLDQPGGAKWRALVDRCRADLAGNGMFNLHGLMRTHLAEHAVADMQIPFRKHAFLHEPDHNIYFKHIDGMDPDHPALRRFRTSNRTLCADQIDGSPLQHLYEWPEFAGFLAATMDMPDLYVMADPLARINVMSYDQGQVLNWHFDRSEFTTLLLQAPEPGGEFEYRTGLRGDSDPNFDGVARL